ncbi:hypothetical protein CAJAP_05596 [Camponotus japonicus]
MKGTREHLPRGHVTNVTQTKVPERWSPSTIIIVDDDVMSIHASFRHDRSGTRRPMGTSLPRRLDRLDPTSITFVERSLWPVVSFKENRVMGKLYARLSADKVGRLYRLAGILRYCA